MCLVLSKIVLKTFRYYLLSVVMYKSSFKPCETALDHDSKEANFSIPAHNPAIKFKYFFILLLNFYL